ncbi:MAG TPA: lysylphosphatidylglycerol synthase transmembrane domain-containing protein [Polyangiales bacterium]|nr:lysylphosphatidylglycerol synthase transmembrane domain-containing protein [Polyangiales bacterium]
MPKRIKNLLKVAFGLGILGWIVSGIRLDELRTLASQGDPLNLVLGVGSLLVAMLYFQWSRLHLLIKGYTDGIATSLKIFYVGALFNNVLPSNIGGDAIRLMYLKSLRADNWGTPFMLLLLYRVSGFTLLVLAGLVYVIFDHDRLLQLLAAQHVLVSLDARSWLIAGAVAFVGLLVALWLLRRLSARMRDRVLGFLRNCRAGLAQLSGGDAVQLVVQTALFHGCRLLSFYYLIQYLGQHVSLWDLLFVISATSIIAVLPVTVAGLGVMEGSITLLLSMYGVTPSSAVAIALVNRAVMLLLAAIGAVIYLTSRDEVARARGNAPPLQAAARGPESG